MAERRQSLSPTSPSNASGLRIQSQIVSGNARVHNGNVYITKRSTTFGTKTRNTILNWLSPLTFYDTHHAIRDKASLQDQASECPSGDSTGQWLLEGDAFESWRARKLFNFWCHGMPGAGKTVLASIVIEHMLELEKNLKPSSDNGRVTFLYLNYKEPQSLEHLVGSVVRQAVQNQDPLPEIVVNAYTDHTRRDTKPKADELSKMLIELASQQPIYIIIDALDECPPKDRKRLIKLLKPKLGEGADWCPVSMLITSRLLDEFQELSADFHRINITANARDIRMFVDYHFKTQTHLRRFAMQDRDFADDVKAQVIQRCNGMFLLAFLHMESLNDQMELASARKVLRELPSGLDGTYKLALDRIGQQSKKKQKLAWDTLAWITHSKRQLSVVELQHALACVPGTQDFDPERIIHEDDIRDVCGGLVVFSQNQVSLVHYTTSTYFNLRKAELFPGFHATIAKTCASYLGLKVLEQPDDEQNSISYADDLYDDPADAKTLDLHRQFDTQSTPFNKSGFNVAPPQRPKILTYRTKCHEFPFFLYAIHGLGHHLRAMSLTECPDDLCETICSLLKSRPKRNFMCRVLYEEMLYWDRSAQKVSTFLDNEYGEAAIILPTVSGTSDESGNAVGPIQDHPEPDYYNDMVFEAILDRLEENGMSVRSPLVSDEEEEMDSDPWDDDTEDDEDSIQDNLSPDAVVTLKDNSALISTAHDEAIASTALRKTRTTRKPEITPLHLAAFLGWGPLIEALADANLDINALDIYGQTPITVATQEGHFGALEALLKRGATVNLDLNQGHAIMLHAALNNQQNIVHDMIIQALIPFKDPIPEDSPPEVVQDAMLLHIFRYLLMVLLVYVQLVREMGSQKRLEPKDQAEEKMAVVISETEKISRSLRMSLQLLAAAETNNVDLVRNLAQDIISNTSKLDGRTSRFLVTALFIAVAFGHASIAEALVLGGVNINAKGLHGQTVLHVATRRNDVNMVKMLLDRGADVRIKDDNGYTPWMANVHTEKLEISQLLLAAGTDVNDENGVGMSTLYTAAAGGHLGIVEFLLSNGANPSIQTRYGWAPLHWSACHGFYEVVKVLLAAGADPNPMSDTSETPLDKALQDGRDSVVELLRKAGGKTAKQINEEWASKSTAESSTDVESDDSSDSEPDSDDYESEHGFMDDEDIRITGMLPAVLNAIKGRTQYSENARELATEFLCRDLGTVLKELHCNEFVTDEDARRWDEVVESFRNGEEGGKRVLTRRETGL